MPSPSTGARRRLAESNASASSSWCHVTVCVRRPSSQTVRFFTREIERVGDAGETRRIRQRQTAPFPARIGQRDQVTGQIAAVDRGDVFGIERPQILRVVPVVEMAAESREAAHASQASPPAARPLRRFRSSRSRGRLRSTGDRGRDWSARSGARAPAPDLPGNCRAAACDRPP